ncbi:hypothetical protein ACFSSE_11370 [Pedobacter alpinus]|uniref:DUF4397 domain-containing protein n=2 Tax=Pedobacter alpinus TaxID=1590643 RepID=A0ABW5TU29_9SPHI
MNGKVSVCFDFKGAGFGSIIISPFYSAFYLQNKPGCRQFSLSPGNYELIIDGVLFEKRASLIILQGTEMLGELILPTGRFSRSISLNVS